MKKKNSNDDLPLVLEAIDREEAVELLQTLARIPSVTGQERQLGVFVADWLSKRGFEVQVFNTTEESPNVVGWLRGDSTGPSLMINGHLDVIPLVDGWNLDPYGAITNDGRVYGHGLRDQKTGVACQLLAANAIRKSGIRLRGDLCVACVSLHTTNSYSIEKGLPKGTSTLMQNGVKTDMAVVTEPTDMDICIGNRGAVTMYLRTKGKASHTATTGAEAGVNAIEKMAKIILAMKDVYYAPGLVPDEIRPYLEGAVCYTNIGVIKGGYERNIVPDWCEVAMDVRYQIGKTVDSIIAEIQEAIRKVQAQDPDVVAEVTPRYQGTKSLAWYISPAHPLVKAARASFKTVTGNEARVVTKPWWADAGALVNEGKIPTLVMGPTGEPIYTSNESAEIEGDLLVGTRALGFLAAEVCASSRDEFEARFGRL